MNEIIERLKQTASEKETLWKNRSNFTAEWQKREQYVEWQRLEEIIKALGE